jgi:hypothetical protein
VLGAAAFALLEELVRPWGQLNVLVYGVLLIVLFTTFREGLAPVLEKAWRAVRRQRSNVVLSQINAGADGKRTMSRTRM